MTANTHRHWKGESGDRHEHQNVWTKGGTKSPAGRAPWAMTPEMMTNPSSTRRRCDTTSKNANNKLSPQTLSHRRCSSAGSGGGLFSNLQMQKRESGDSGMVGRRESWNEQREQGGFLSKLWDGYTRGK